LSLFLHLLELIILFTWSQPVVLCHEHTSRLPYPTMTTSYYQHQYPLTGSLPVSVHGKSPQQTYARHERTPSAYSQISASPPERPDSVSTSSAGLYSAASSSYAGSEYDSYTTGATSVDLLDYMSDRLSQAYNPIPLDRNLAKQAQMYVSRLIHMNDLHELMFSDGSGELNAKTRELLALQAQARARLAKTRANFAEGMKAAKDVQRDLEWTQRKVRYVARLTRHTVRSSNRSSSALNARAAAKYPDQYRAARERCPSLVDY